MAIWSSLGQLDGRDRWLGDWRKDFPTSVKDKMHRKKALLFPSFLLPSCLCHTWECNAWSSGSLLWQRRKSPDHWGHHWATKPTGMACLQVTCKVRLIISSISATGHSITFNQRHALPSNESKTWIIYPETILCFPLPDCSQILIWVSSLPCIPCSQWKQILPPFPEMVIGG